jgi:hypothetical protein
MFELGQKRKSGPPILTSVLPSTADVRQRGGHVRKVPMNEPALRERAARGAGAGAGAADGVTR